MKALGIPSFGDRVLPLVVAGWQVGAICTGTAKRTRRSVWGARVPLVALGITRLKRNIERSGLLGLVRIGLWDS